MAEPPELSEDEKLLLWDAIEVTYLAELRNGSEDYAPASVEEQRKRMGDALVGLITKGLARAYLATWEPPQAVARYVSLRELAEWLTSGKAWDLEERLMVAFEATAEGQTLYLGKPLTPNE